MVAGTTGLGVLETLEASWGNMGMASELVIDDSDICGRKNCSIERMLNVETLNARLRG
jgi:hypothetical protein